MLIRSTALYAPAMAAPRLAAFVLILYLTRRLAPGEFGFFSLVTVVGEILDMSASNWVRFSLLRSDTLRPRTWRNAFWKCGVLLAATTAVACCAGVATSFGVAHEKVVGFSLALSAYVISNSSLRFGLTALQMNQRRVEYSAIEILRSGGLLVSAWLASRGPNASFVAVALANASVTGAFAAYACWRAFAVLPQGSETAAGYWPRLVYGLPIIALQIVQYSVASSDRIVLKLLMGAASVGIYAAGYSLARVPIDIVGNAVNQGGFPEFMRIYDERGPDGAARFVEHAFELMTLLLFGTMGVSVGVSTAMVHALLPAKYHDVAGAVIPIITLGAVFMGLKSYVFDNIFHAARRNWFQVLTYGPAGLATVLSCFILIPMLGRTGGAIAFTVGAAVGLGASYAATRRLIRPRLDWKEFAKTIVAAVAAGLAGRWAEFATAGWPALLALALAALCSAFVWAMMVLVLRVRVTDGLIGRRLGVLRRRFRAAA